jgi:hypothetical protein
MKTSNKILLGGFMTALVLLGTVLATLFTKYRNKDYTYLPPDDDMQSMVMQSFPHVKFVSVRHIANASVDFGDTASLGKLDAGHVSLVHRGDSLLITGKDSSRNTNGTAGIYLVLPRAAVLHAHRSTLSFHTRAESRGNNPVVYLDRSRGNFADVPETLSLDTLRLTATNDSRAQFHTASIGALFLRLDHSTVEDLSASIGTLNITSDSSSRISLQAKHFSKAVTKGGAHE